MNVFKRFGGREKLFLNDSVDREHFPRIFS